MTDRPHALEELVRDGLTRGFLVELPPDAAERLLADAIRIDVPAGGIVYREEEHPRVMVVASGLLRVYVSSAEGRQVTIRYARSGDVVGLALAIGGPAPLSIQAITAASVVALRVEALRALLATDAAVARLGAEEMTRQFYRALEGVADSAFSSVRQRVVRQLLDLAGPSVGTALTARVSQQDLADATGSVREVVTRVLRELREEGLIETHRDEIVLLEPVRLGDEVTGGTTRHQA